MSPSILLEQSCGSGALDGQLTKSKPVVQEHELHSTRPDSESKLRLYRNPSLQVTPDHQLKLVEAPVYQPGPGEVLLHIKATGVCG